MKRFLTILTVLFTGTLWGADLSLSYVHPSSVAIDWDGINDVDGDASLAFTALGDVQTATLRVLCNSLNGYTLTFNTANATGTDSSELKNGADGIGYSVAMSTAGISNATLASSTLVLNNPSSPSLDVNFNGGGDVLPLDGSTQANEVGFTLTVDTFAGELKPQGTYTDVITATAALN